MKRLRRTITGVVIGAALFFAASHAAAQGGGGQVLKLDEMEVEGQIQKPDVRFFLSNAKLEYEELEPKRSFMPELLDSVNKEPF